jgi:Na+:H+ antiporter, NhaA family
MRLARRRAGPSQLGVRMADEAASHASMFRLQQPIDLARDHVRGGTGGQATYSVVVYSDYLCPYCRRLRVVLARLRQTLGDRLAYAFRHFPNETAHPGATFVARAAEAADRQGHFWEMHDLLYNQDLPLGEGDVRDIARAIGLDMERFERDLASEVVAQRVDRDLIEGRRNGVAGTPTIFVDGIRYDGAWDYYSMLEALQRPVAAQLQRQARVFANLPASAGFVLFVAAVAALICANTALAPYYNLFIESSFGIGPPGGLLSLTVGEWFSEGLLAIFFLLVGLEIRREMTSGALSDPRAASLPVIAAVGGVLVPAAIYLSLNQGPTAPGWAVPTATDIAFTLGVLALLGNRVPASLRVFVAALAVVDDILSVLTLAIFFPKSFDVSWLMVGCVLSAGLYALNRWRVYVSWPYLVVAAALWFAFHGAGVHAALAGVMLAAFLPTRPAPQAGPLLAQAATALDALEQAERDGHGEQQSIWDWAGRQLAAASERLLSPAERVERAVSPWSAYAILPLFAFSATGVSLAVDFSSPGTAEIAAGVVLGLVFGKPIGVGLASFAAIKSKLAIAPEGVTLIKFIGAACLCGIGDTVAILLADQAFSDGPESSIAKIAVLVGSATAAVLGAAIIMAAPQGAPVTATAPQEA